MLIIGSGGHTLSCLNIIEKLNKFKIVGLLICKNKFIIKYEVRK